MASKDCLHFTKLEYLNSINEKGLQIRLSKNSYAVSDKKSKISFSEGKIGAIGLYANFYEVYTQYKSGQRKPKSDNEKELKTYREIMNSKSLEEFLGNGVYLHFDGTNIENEGGNHGDGGIYDGSTRTPIDSKDLSVAVIRNNDTKEVSYSMYDYIHYLMATMTPEEYLQMIPPMQERYNEYYKTHKDEILKYRHGNYSEKEVDLNTFCRVCKKDIDKTIKDSKEQEESR